MSFTVRFNAPPDTAPELESGFRGSVNVWIVDQVPAVGDTVTYDTEDFSGPVMYVRHVSWSFGPRGLREARVQLSDRAARE